MWWQQPRALIAIRAFEEIYLFIFAGGSRVCLTGFFIPTRLEKGGGGSKSRTAPVRMFRRCFYFIFSN